MVRSQAWRQPPSTDRPFRHPCREETRATHCSCRAIRSTQYNHPGLPLLPPPSKSRPIARLSIGTAPCLPVSMYGQKATCNNCSQPQYHTRSTTPPFHTPSTPISSPTLPYAPSPAPNPKHGGVTATRAHRSGRRSTLSGFSLCLVHTHPIYPIYLPLHLHRRCSPDVIEARCD